VVPWKGLLALIEPHYPIAGRRGRQPYPRRQCCASTSCSSGTRWATRRWKKHCMTRR
jgi:IS5 family transposase